MVKLIPRGGRAPQRPPPGSAPVLSSLNVEVQSGQVTKGQDAEISFDPDGHCGHYHAFRDSPGRSFQKLLAKKLRLPYVIVK